MYLRSTRDIPFDGLIHANATPSIPPHPGAPPPADCLRDPHGVGLRSGDVRSRLLQGLSEGKALWGHLHRPQQDVSRRPGVRMRRGMIGAGSRIAFLIAALTACGGGGTYEDRGWEEVPPSRFPDEGYAEEETERIEDGTHSAMIDYYNPETGYSATYDLDVEVEGGEVSTIYFPNGGYLDGSYIYPEALDSEGRTSLVDDQGREFEVEVDP